MLRLLSLLIVTLLIPTISYSLENLREYKGFEQLSDEESNEILLAPKVLNEKTFEKPIRDFLPVVNQQAADLKNCQQAGAMLVFNHNEEDFISACKQAIENGVADAGFIIGHQLMMGEWIAADLTQSIKYLETAADTGSRSAKRSLISYYTNPFMPINDHERALSLAQDLSKSGLKWDQFVLANLQASNGSKESAQIGFSKLIALANQGYHSAAVSAAMVKVKKGPLQDIGAAKRIFEKSEVESDIHVNILEVLIDIMEDNLVSARKRLKQCHNSSSACSNLYFHFLTMGIGGEKDNWKANDIIERSYKRWPKIMFNRYAWSKATFSEPPIYDPVAAKKALEYMPEYKKKIPAFLDTVAAVYAANNDFEQALKLQEETKVLSQGKGLSRIFDHMKDKLITYKNKKRWVDPSNASDFIEKIKSFNNLNETELELTSL